MEGFELLKLEDFTDFVEKSNVEAGSEAVVSVAADENRTLLASCVEPSATAARPTSNPSPGYNFSVIFTRPEVTTKATPFMFSSDLQKLFVDMAKPCPVKFSIAVPDELAHYKIYCRVVYARPEHHSEAIQRCPNHQETDRSDDKSRVHVLRCDHKEAHYITAEAPGQHNQVVLPLDKMSVQPQSKSGAGQVPVCFLFMCRSSCPAINRRATKLVFCLVRTKDATEMARQEVVVRICSCPGRDCKSEEERMRKKVCLDPYESVDSRAKNRSIHELDMEEEEDVLAKLSKEERRHFFSWLYQSYQQHQQQQHQPQQQQ